ILFHKLSAWIAVFNGVIVWDEESLTKCNTIIRTVWVADINDRHQPLEKYEQVWALSITALTKAWEAFKFRDSSADISSDLRYNLLPELGKVLIQAAQSIMQTMSDNSQQVQGDLIVEGNEDTVTRAAGLLRALGQVISTKLELGGEVQLGGVARKYENWYNLETLFQTEIASIEFSLGTDHA
ncbi:hypothetical protein GGX14DRAFT_450379, partial [Mycena pura]